MLTYRRSQQSMDLKFGNTRLKRVVILGGGKNINERLLRWTRSTRNEPLVGLPEQNSRLSPTSDT